MRPARMNEKPEKAPPNTLVRQVDELLRHQHTPATGETDVPVLTEVVEDDRAQRPALDPQALEALARELERAVLERLGPEVERVIEEKLARALSSVLGESIAGMRTELTQNVTQMVREAIAASVARTLTPDKK